MWTQAFYTAFFFLKPFWIVAMKIIERWLVLWTVVQVNNILGFERTIGGLWRLGSVSVTSVPVVSYENFAQNLEVDLSLITSPPRPLPKENLYYWSFDVGYSGESNCYCNLLCLTPTHPLHFWLLEYWWLFRLQLHFSQLWPNAWLL